MRTPDVPSIRCSSPLIKVPRITLPRGFDGWAPFKPDRSLLAGVTSHQDTTYSTQ